MKWLKRIFLIAAIVLTLVIIAASTGVYLYRGRPSWYRTHVLSARQRSETVNRVDQKFADVFSWAAAVEAQQVRHRIGRAAANEPEIGTKTVVITEDEFNAFVENWQSPNKPEFQKWFSTYFTDGRIILEDNAILLGGQSKDLGTLISVEFDPSINAQGQLRLDMQSVSAGRLPLPRAVLGNRLAVLHDWLARRLAENQNWAEIDPTMVANGCAMAAATSRLLLDAMDDAPSDPILFVPFNLRDLRQSLAVRVSALKVAQGSITLTLVPISGADNAAVLESLKKPYPAPPPVPAKTAQ
jgi:hypothetical protein